MSAITERESHHLAVAALRYELFYLRDLIVEVDLDELDADELDTVAHLVHLSGARAIRLSAEARRSGR